MSDERVTIGSYEFVAEAEVAQMFLSENGVEATLREDGVVGMNWLGSLRNRSSGRSGQ